MLQLNPGPTVEAAQAPDFKARQPLRLVLALMLLVIALAGVLVRDRDFWFGSERSALDSDASEPVVAPQTPPKSAPNAAATVQPAPVPAPAKKHLPVAQAPAEPKAADSPAVAMNRTVLPPLDVEVVAGDTHRTVHPGSNVAKVEIAHPGSTAPAKSAAALAAATNAADRERMTIDTGAQQTSYPLLAQHMNVQGSVVLQAIIGADGIIQDLHVLSGPAILASAAQQAVREWHFKPFVQNGQPVETKAKITVNFTIKVADNAPKTS
jgi:protein TonB